MKRYISAITVGCFIVAAFSAQACKVLKYDYDNKPKKVKRPSLRLNIKKARKEAGKNKLKNYALNGCWPPTSM